jgi:hypothetical protein
VQSEEFFLTSLVFFLLFFSALLLMTVLRVTAIKRYQSERKSAGEKSALGSLGDSLSNMQSIVFNVLHSVLFIFTFESGVFLFQDQLGYENTQLVLLAGLSGVLVVLVAYLGLTVDGRAHWREARIESDYQAFGHEDRILQIRLAELVRDTQASTISRVEVAQRVLNRLMVKENKTGDAVRRIMSSPEQLQNVSNGRIIPGPLRYLRVSLFLLAVLVITVTVVFLGVLSGLASFYELAGEAFPLQLVLTAALVCCLCLEGSSANEKRRKALYHLP